MIPCRCDPATGRLSLCVRRKAQHGASSTVCVYFPVRPPPALARADGPGRDSPDVKFDRLVKLAKHLFTLSAVNSSTTAGRGDNI